MKSTSRFLFSLIVLCMMLLPSAIAEEVDMSYLSEVIVEKNALDVSITLPPEMVTTESAWEGSIPPVFNADGGMTLTLTYSEFNDYLNTLRTSLNDSLRDMVADESFGFELIEANENFTNYVITVAGEELGFGGIFGVYGMLLSSALYSAYSGEVPNTISFTVVSGDTGAIISSFTDADLREISFE